MVGATIEELVRELSIGQVPMICLDTCDFLDVVRGVPGNLHQVRSFSRMLSALDLDKNRFRLLITYLTKHEWGQNRAEVERSTNKFLVETFDSVRKIADARSLVGLPASIDPGLFDAKLVRELVGELVGLAQSVMDFATVLEKDASCVALALERVMTHLRPSHKNEIKDSIHWEHYLELSRQLKAASHTQPRIFVSANKEDFWHKVDKIYHPTINHELKVETDAAGLQFLGKLDDALGVLGI
jgi:PIN domain